MSRRVMRHDKGVTTPTATQALRVVVAVAGGVVIGAAIWSRVLDTNRRGLFSPHPVRRFAAISYLGGHPSVDTARLLRDYIRWETQPLLRRRARRVLRLVEVSLDR